MATSGNSPFSALGMTVQEFAERIGASDGFVYSHLRHIPHVRIGKRYRIKWEAAKQIERILSDIAEEMTEQQIAKMHHAVAETARAPKAKTEIPVVPGNAGKGNYVLASTEYMDKPTYQTYLVGEYVTHPSFGVGKVEKAVKTPSGRDQQLTVNFGFPTGTKRLLASIARLKIHVPLTLPGVDTPIEPTPIPSVVVEEAPVKDEPPPKTCRVYRIGDSVEHKDLGLGRICAVRDLSTGCQEITIDFFVPSVGQRRFLSFNKDIVYRSNEYVYGPDDI